MSIFSSLLSGGVKDAAEGAVTLAKGLRTAITGVESMDNDTKIRFEELARQAEDQATKLVSVKQQVTLAVNETMQAEAKSEHWPQYSWRPFWGFVSGGAFLVVVVLCCWLAFKAVSGAKPDALTMIPQLVTSFTGLFAIPGAILGVSAWHRGKQKREQSK